MYHSWLDRWDERHAERGDKVKATSDFVVDAELAFPEVAKALSAVTTSEIIKLAKQAVVDPTYFCGPELPDDCFEQVDDWIKFQSEIATNVEENNLVWAKITESGSMNHVLVIFHHWNASSWNTQIARFFSKRGITVVEMALPYHFQRSRPDSAHADGILSPNLGRTIQSMRQAVLDGRKLIRLLHSRGYETTSVLGMSLGSWVAGLVAAHDESVTKASLFLSAGNFADFVWTGRATQKIRESLETAIDLPVLESAWAPLNLENYSDKLARCNLNLQIVLATRDKVVLPSISARFLAKLKEADASPDILKLNCGHYSLAMPPHILLAGFRLKRLLQLSHGTTTDCY